MIAAATDRAVMRHLGCECSAELYNLVRERAAATGDSMAGVLRSALVEHLGEKRCDSDPVSASAVDGIDSAESGGTEAAQGRRAGGRLTHADDADDLTSVVDMIASSMSAAMKSAVVEFLMGRPEPLKATCRASGSTIGDGLWFMAEFLRLYSDWGYPAGSATIDIKPSGTVAGVSRLGLSDIS